MTTPSPYGQPANPGPYGAGYNQFIYPPPAAGQPYAPAYGQPAHPGPYGAGYNQPVYPAAGQPYAPAYGQPYVVPKSKTAAALLAFFLGWIGAHNFYRGQVGRGFGHIALDIVAIICVVIAMAMTMNAADLPVYATMSDTEVASLAGASALVWLVNAVNGIWVFIEFIMILVSKDGSLQ